MFRRSFRFFTAATPPTGGGSTLPASHRAVPGPHRRVGNIFLVHCIDLPAKHSPIINKLLRDLRIEFKGQLVAHPDVPSVRERLFRLRHVVRIEMIDTDEMKRLLGVPAHVSFSDLAAQLPPTVGIPPGGQHPHVRQATAFQHGRKHRMMDILERDEVELKLLAARRARLLKEGGGAETEKNGEQ